jgi:hypothetical protein
MLGRPIYVYMSEEREKKLNIGWLSSLDRSFCGEERRRCRDEDDGGGEGELTEGKVERRW